MRRFPRVQRCPDLGGPDKGGLSVFHLLTQDGCGKTLMFFASVRKKILLNRMHSRWVLFQM